MIQVLEKRNKNNMLSVFFPSCVGPVEERARLVYRVNCLFRFASVLMSGLVDVLCFAPRWVGAESSLMEGCAGDPSSPGSVQELVWLFSLLWE